MHKRNGPQAPPGRGAVTARQVSVCPSAHLGAPAHPSSESLPTLPHTRRECPTPRKAWSSPPGEPCSPPRPRGEARYRRVWPSGLDHPASGFPPRFRGTPVAAALPVRKGKQSDRLFRPLHPLGQATLYIHCTDEDTEDQGGEDV